MTDLVRVCDCGACNTPLDNHPHGPDGAYCSQRCADHAGQPLPAAQAEHQEQP